MINQSFTLSVAPMMDWTDRHCRWFHRQLSSRALLYTEMVVADAVIHGNREHLLGYHSEEHPVALQVGGSDPDKLAHAARIGADYGYDEVNLNVGCPSDRVQSGRFGACLMGEPDLVADCFRAMKEVVDIPVTIKCRVGIDDQDAAQTLPHFLQTVSEAGCTHFIVHARKAWLHGLSPKENRTVPPLQYDLVREMKRQFPKLEIVLNGGIETLADVKTQTAEHEIPLDGAMIGRAAYHNPWLLSRVDEDVFGAKAFTKTRDDIVQNLISYARSVQETDPSAKALVRHIMGLFHGEKGARIWRRSLSESVHIERPSERIEMAYGAYVAQRNLMAQTG